MITVIVLSIIAGVALLLAIPIQIQISSTPCPTLSIQWLMVRFYALKMETSVHSFLTVFGFTIPQKKKPVVRKTAPKAAKKNSGKKKRSKNVKFSEVKKVILSPDIRPIVYQVLKFFVRILKGFKIKRLSCDIGQQDFQLQGMICGLVYAIPQSKRISIRCNFQEHNSLDCNVHFYIWKFIGSIFLLLLFFPYVRMYKLIKLIK